MDIDSGLFISQADGRPMYQQVAERIKLLISTGDWKPGQEIPSIRALAAAISVSVITVQRAYHELESDGVIVSRHGRGTFVTDRTNLGADLREQELDKYLAAAADLADRLDLSAKELEKRLASFRRNIKRHRA
jgi:GntR family transcriptional regulator